MANNIGTLVTSTVRPQSDADRFATVLAAEVSGGFRPVADITARNAIFPEVRTEGMLVTTVADTGFWRLQGGTDNGNWVNVFAGIPTGNYALLTDFNNEVNARISGDNSLNSSISSLSGSFTSLSSSVNSISGTVTGLAQRTTTLESGFNNITGGISNFTGALLDRDIQYGLNVYRQNAIFGAMGDLNPRNIAGGDQTSIPRTGFASQTGGSISGVGFNFYPADMGRRIIFNDGTDSLITGLVQQGTYYWDPTTVVLTDRQQNVSGQTFKIQAKGLCFVGMGDSTGYSSYTDLRNKLYRAYGFGGSFISAASDTTAGRYETVILSSGAAQINNAFDCAPAGLAWLVPVGGIVEGYTYPKYKTNINDDPTVFDITQEERLSDYATIFIKKKANATVRIERRRHEDLDWVVVGDNLDISTGSEDIVTFKYSHPLDICWHYKITVLSDTSGTGVTIVGILLENRTTPGFIYVCWDTGGSKITDYNTITTSSLRVLNSVLKFDCVLYQFRDYGPGGTGQVPNLPVILPQVTQKWKDAGCRNVWTFVGGYNNDDNTVYAENEAYRTFALANGHMWIDLRAFVATFNEAWIFGNMSDGTHLGGKGGRTVGNYIGQALGLLDNPWGSATQDVKALNGSIDFLKIQGRDVRLTIEAAKDGPWENGVKLVSGSYAAWATIPAPGTSGFAVQLWVDIPTTNPVSTLALFGVHPGITTSNAAKTVTSAIDTSGRLIVVFRNYDNTGTATYRLTNFIQQYGGQRGCLTIIVDPSKDHPTVYFGTQKANLHCQNEYSATVGQTIQKINEPFDVAGTNFNLGISSTHFARAAALWVGLISESELLRNAERGQVISTTNPTAYWFASTGSGRNIFDISGNNRHILLRNASPASVNDSGDGSSTGFVWLRPTSVRTTFVMTSNSGMVARQGEDIIVNITAGTLGTINLPATPDASGPSTRVFGVSAGGWRIAQPANVQIATGAGAVEGKDITTAGVNGYVQSANRYDFIELKAISTILWTSPAFPAGATVAITPNGLTTTDPLNVSAARAAAWTRGGIRTPGAIYSSWGTIPALGTSGFTAQIWKQVPLTNPVAILPLFWVSSNQSFSNQAGLLAVNIDTSGRLTVLIRDSLNTSSQTYILGGFVTKYAGRFDSITVRFDPAKSTPEVWIGNERADSVGGGNLTWTNQPVGGSPPTMATANFTGTLLHVGADTATYQFALWNSPITDSEIVSNATAARAIGSTAMVVYYLFNEGRGRYIYDYSGNNRHLRGTTISNTTYDDSGNGITTGLVWLNPLKTPVYTGAIDLQGARLRQGEQFEVIGNGQRKPLLLPDVVFKEFGSINILNYGAQGFQINQPSGHRIIISGSGDITGSNSTTLGTGGYIQSTNYLTEFSLRPIIIDTGSSQVTWYGRLGAGSVSLF